MTSMTEIKTLANLKKSSYKSKTIKNEVRDNLSGYLRDEKIVCPPYFRI